MSFDLSKVDVSALEGGIGTLLVQELAPVLGAAEQDLKDFGLAIARDGLRAVLAGDKDWQAELKGQVKALLEVQRIRVEVVDWDLTEKIVGLVLKAAAAAIGAAIPKP